MRAKTLFVLWLVSLHFAICSSIAQLAYPAPPGGWTYIYNGDQLQVGASGSGYVNLDGTWAHDNNSDEWDGSEIGGVFGASNRPGGASLGTQGAARYLRMQDTGDPRDYDSSASEFDDPGSNRKIYFGHNIGSDIDAGKAATIMDTGVTLTFRARIPTVAKAGGPLDPLHRDGQNASGVQPYPENGDGYVTSDGGKGNFVVRQGGNGGDVPAGAIAFSFTQTTDTTGGNPNTGRAGFAGLTFNEFNGNVPTANVNFGQGTKTNVVAFDPTEWHEIYIVIRKDPANIGTHEAFIFRDGNLTPTVFKMTAGTGADMPDSFLAMGGSATPQNWALDVDWFGYKDEAVFPPGALLPPSIFGFSPVHQAMFHPATNGLRFSASALMPTNRLPASGIKLIVNGQDVSGQLTLTGTDASASRTATYRGLQPNAVYNTAIIVTDSGGLSSTNEVSFDTFVEAQGIFIEAEDYNHGSGQFVDNPAPGAYASLAGTVGIDFVDTTPNSLGTYRSSDAVDTATAPDIARSRFTSAGATDYQVGTITSGEWLNYTRTLPTGQYHVWLRFSSTAAQSVRLDRITGAVNQPNQASQFLGAFNAPRSGTLNLFEYVPLTDLQGRPIAVPLAGLTTLRLTSVAGNNDLALNYLLLAPAGATAGGSIVAVTPSPGAVGVLGDAVIETAIYDGSNAVDQASVKLRVNGAEVPATVAKANGVTTLKHTPARVWAPGASNSVTLAFNDGVARSFDWSFTTANYPVLTPGMKVTNATVPGFVWNIHQNEGNQEATLQRTETALSGQLGLANLADPSVVGPASGLGTPAQPGNGVMTFPIPTVINVGQDTFGNFGTFTPDEQMPGIPGLNGSDNGIAVEIKTFLSLPAGWITMGVNSDDGFRTTAGYLNNTPLVLGLFDAGRSAGDTIFQFAVQEAGVYAFRTIYFEAGGGASLEWFSVKPGGGRVLINDTANGGFAAFQRGTVPAPPAAASIGARLNAARQVLIDWTGGVLVSADVVTGPYQPVAGATSPLQINPAEARQKFYRVQFQ